MMWGIDIVCVGREGVTETRGMSQVHQLGGYAEYLVVGGVNNDSGRAVDVQQ